MSCVSATDWKMYSSFGKPRTECCVYLLTGHSIWSWLQSGWMHLPGSGCRREQEQSQALGGRRDTIRWRDDINWTLVKWSQTTEYTPQQTQNIPFLRFYNAAIVIEVGLCTIKGHFTVKAALNMSHGGLKLEFLCSVQQNNIHTWICFLSLLRS